MRGGARVVGGGLTAHATDPADIISDLGRRLVSLNRRRKRLALFYADPVLTFGGLLLLVLVFRWGQWLGQRDERKRWEQQVAPRNDSGRD